MEHRRSYPTIPPALVKRLKARRPFPIRKKTIQPHIGKQTAGSSAKGVSEANLPDDSRLASLKLLPVEVWEWILLKCVSDRVKRCATPREILRLRLVSRMFDDLVLRCLFGKGGEEWIVTAIKKVPFRFDITFLRLLGDDLVAKFLFYRHFNTTKRATYLWESVWQHVVQVEPEAQHQECLLKRVLSLLTWNKKMRVFGLMEKDDAKAKELVDEDQKLWQFSFILLQGDMERIATILPHIADLNKHSYLFGSFLLAAVVGGNYEAAQSLVNAGVDVASSIFPLSKACFDNNIQIIELLLQAKAEKDRPYKEQSWDPPKNDWWEGNRYTDAWWAKEGWDPLFVCCRFGKLETALLLIEANNQLRPLRPWLPTPRRSSVKTTWYRPGAIYSAIAQALSRGHLKMAQTLLDRALHAFRGDKPAGLELLLFEVFRTGNRNMLDQLLIRVPLEYILKTRAVMLGAAHGGRIDMARWLSKRKYLFSQHYKACRGAALIVACYNGHLNMVDFLRTQSSPYYFLPTDFDVSSWCLLGGWSPLETAILHDHAHIVQLLLQHGANPDGLGREDAHGCPLSTACEHGAYKSVEVLLRHGVMVNRGRNEGSFMPVEVAYDNGFDSIARLLLEVGAVTRRTEILRLRYA